MEEQKNDLGVAPAEPVAGLSVTSPQPSASGLSTSIPNARMHDGGIIPNSDVKTFYKRKIGNMAIRFYELMNGEMAVNADDAAEFFGVRIMVNEDHRDSDRSGTPQATEGSAE